MTWGDDGFQRHGAARKGREGRLQDKFGDTYDIVENDDRKYKLKGDGEWSGKWVGHEDLRRFGLRRV